MTQHNLTQILKVIRDLVMRNRPCYRDYLGTETMTNTVQIGSSIFEDGKGIAETGFLVTDPAFTSFVLGETYTVTIDGITADYVARNLSPISDNAGPVIGTTTTFNMENHTFDGWICAAGRNHDGKVTCMAQTLDMSFVGKTLSISQTRTETVTHYKTKLLPEYLLPTFLRKNVVASKSEVQKAQTTADRARNAADNAQIAANNAQTAANAAQTAADNAQTTANTAKSTADNAKTTADAAQADVSSAKIMSEMVTNSTNVVFKNKELLSSGLHDSDGTRYWTFPSSAVLIGSQITFQHPGGKASGIWNGKKLTLKVPSYGGEERTVIFSLSPAGRGMIIKIPNPAWSENLGLWYSWTEVVYWKNNDDIGTAAVIPDYAIASGIRLISTTGNKQFLITVDGTGTLKATEVT